jgi:hypothetical protein
MVAISFGWLLKPDVLNGVRASYNTRACGDGSDADLRPQRMGAVKIAGKKNRGRRCGGPRLTSVN